MLPGNSFPQICVVSETSLWKTCDFAQEYLGAVAESNSNFTFSYVPRSSPELPRRPSSCGSRERLSADTDSLMRLSDAGLAHEPPDISLHSALLDAQLGCNLACGVCLQEQLENLLLPKSKLRISSGRPRARNLEQPINEAGEQTARRPNRAGSHNFDGFANHLRACTETQVAPGSRNDGAQNQFIVALRPDHNQTHIRARVANDFQGLEAAGGGMQIDDNVLDAGESEQLRQAPDHGDELGLILLRGLVEDAGKARNADGIVGRQQPMRIGSELRVEDILPLPCSAQVAAQWPARISFKTHCSSLELNCPRIWFESRLAGPSLSDCLNLNHLLDEKKLNTT